MRTTVALIGATVLVAGCGGGASGDAGTGPGTAQGDQVQDGAGPVGLGEPASFTHGDASGTVTATSVRRIAEAEQPPGVAQPPENGSFLVVDVTITVADGTLLYNSLDFRLPGEGGDFQRSLPIVLGNTGLGSGELAAGDQVTGEVAFDVPEGDILIEYAPQAAPGAALLRVEG